MGEKYKRADRHFKFEAAQLHRGQKHPDLMTGARTIPIHQTSPYVFDNCNYAAVRFNPSDPGNIYSHLANPTLDIFEQRMVQLEGGVVALATASGAATLPYTFQNLTRAGDHIVSSGHIYGDTYNYLTCTFPKYGVETTFVDPSDLETVEAAVRDNTKTVFIETLGNPNSDIAGIEKIVSITCRHQTPLVIDNILATPYLVRPVRCDAGTVVHLAIKFIDDHGTTVGGVIVDGGRLDWAASGKFSGFTKPSAGYHGIRFTQDVRTATFVTRIRTIPLRDIGTTLSPFHRLLFLQGLETLSLRVGHYVENALEVVEYLRAHPQIEEVHHPSVSQDSIQQQLYEKYFPRGDGSIFAFRIRGRAEKAKEFIDDLELFSLPANVMDAKSLVIHPASATHPRMNERELLEQGIRPETIHLSIGTEHIDDILEGLEEAFRSVL